MVDKISLDFPILIKRLDTQNDILKRQNVILERIATALENQTKRWSDVELNYTDKAPEGKTE